MMTKRSGGSFSHADTSSACTAGSFYSFNTTKVAQELFVQDLLNLQILDDCIYSRRFEGLSLFALSKKTPLDVNSRLRQSKSYSNIRNQQGPPGDPPLTYILTCTLQLKKEVGNPNKLFIISRCYSL
jgi:hypothetical protein